MSRFWKSLAAVAVVTLTTGARIAGAQVVEPMADREPPALAVTLK